jgi:hypothetical protein
MIVATSSLLRGRLRRGTAPGSEILDANSRVRQIQCVQDRDLEDVSLSTRST